MRHQQLLTLAERDFAKWMNRHFEEHGWNVHPERWGRANDGKRVRIDAILTLRKDLRHLLPPNYHGAQAIAVEYKDSRLYQGELAGNFLTQVLSYVTTEWEMPDESLGLSRTSRLPVFLIPGWRQRVGRSELQIHQDLHSFIGKQGVGQGVLDSLGGVVACHLELRNACFWESRFRPWPSKEQNSVVGKSFRMVQERFGPAATWSTLLTTSGHQ